MRNLVCTLSLLFISITSINAQSYSVELQKPVLLPVYTATFQNCEVLQIPTMYAKSVFDSLTDITPLVQAEILGIDLVYTDYPSYDSFYDLNRKRLLSLEKILTGIDLSKISVKLYRQNSVSNRKDAEKCFHGFVIYYKKKKAEPEKITEEVSLKKKISDSGSLSARPKIRSGDSFLIKSPYMTDGEFIQKLIDSDFNSDSLLKIKEAYLHPIDSTAMDYFVCYTPELYKSYKNNKANKVKIYTKSEMVEKGYLQKSALKYYKECDDFIYITGKIPSFSSLARFYTPDSTVQKVLSRNSWSKMMVCADVTGSMTPHVIQLMFWLKLNANNRSLRYFTAFNDGDNIADKNKKIGSTGGIYSTNSWNYIDLAKTVYKAVNAGQGGDIGENDIEGLLDGQNNAVDCENYILIADNNAPVKDISLLKKITKPIKVVVCGAKANINVDYLNIARKTGGSVHTIEDDITNLALLKEGEIFEFKGRQYKIKGGSFIDITVNETKL